MSLKDLFKEGKYKYLAATSLDELTGNIESPEYVEVYLKEKERFTPLVDYSNPGSFARFGSAEKYYYDSIKWITKSYPYDGSKKEKIQWELSSSHVDLHILENGYPRTTGYATFSTSSLTATDTSVDYDVWGSYGAAGTASYEYIFVNGGPHEGQGPSKVFINPDTGKAQYRQNANIWDTSKNRECNLKIGGTDGNTVEFWLKKEAFNVAATQKEVIFDIHTTSSISSSADYARLRVELTGTKGTGGTGTTPFLLTYMSGTAGFANQAIGTSLTTASIADDSWHHYAFRLKNTGSNVVADLFVDGIHNHRVTAGTNVSYVSGTIVGTLGALATYPSGTHGGAPRAYKGWGKLSGSIDEFRYWKKWRTSDQIQLRWFDQIGGGTNSDDANTDLGVYYKFNEGITLTSSTDSIVLDYSGRISNGSWTGYNLGGGTYSRSTGSAIDDTDLTTFVNTEFKDPIIRHNNPDVRSYLATKRSEGKIYDYANPSNLYYSLPSWLIEEHEANNPDNEGIVDNSLWNLTQLLSSQFDQYATEIKCLPQIPQNDYLSSSSKPIPFADRMLEGKHFISPEIFSAINALEALENRGETKVYTEKIYDIKNLIYQNIYNNLEYINKSKGTEKSFRNLVRCFGVDDEIYKFNVYANAADYTLRDNYRTVSETYKFINHNSIYNADATIYQYSSSLNDNSTTFISASMDYDTIESPEANFPFSVEANIIFPKRELTYADTKQYVSGATETINNYPLMLTASLFGMHTAIGLVPQTTQWATNDYANFIVKAIKPKTYTDTAKFVLTGTDGGFFHPALTSSEINGVYDDNNWSFAVSLYPEKYPSANEVIGTSGSVAGRANYVVKFSGVQSVLDTTIQEFSVTGSMTAEQATKFLASPKRVFTGAHRTNFTGALLTPTDIKFNNLRVWQNKLDVDDLKLHASYPANYGIGNSAENAYLFNSSINRVFVPNYETLLLHWNFDNVTGSNVLGDFLVEDLTSGSAEQINRYGWLGELNKKQYLGKGYEFQTSSTNVYINDNLVVSKHNLPEVFGSDDMINVLQNDDIYYTRDKRPIFFDLYVEKSPYQNISDEIMKFLSTAIEFNNLIGPTLYRYRDEYKPLSTLRQLFFQRMDGAPDIDKYVEYFKWFDIAVSAMIQKIAPMSSGLDERPLRNVIESHILERNKYRSKFPSYEFKQSDPEASLFGVNEMLYNWKFGHAPLGADYVNRYSIAFDGVTNKSKLTVADAADLSFGADGTTGNEPSFSISTWINITESNFFYIMNKGEHNANLHEYRLFVDGDVAGNKLTFYIFDTNGAVTPANQVRIGQASTTSFTSYEGEWVHVVATYDGSRADSGITLYLNGAEIASSAANNGSYTAMHATAADMAIGKLYPDLTANVSEGFIDEVAIFNKELSSTEVVELYHDGSTWDIGTFFYNAKDNLVSWWRMGDKATGTSPNFTIPDQIGSNNATMADFQGTPTSGLVTDFPLSNPIQNSNCLWWKERAARSNVNISSSAGGSLIDADRQEILDVFNNENNASAPNLSGSDGTYVGSTYALRRFARPYKVKADVLEQLHGGTNFSINKKVDYFNAISRQFYSASEGSTPNSLQINSSGITSASAEWCQDNSALNDKPKVTYTAIENEFGSTTEYVGGFVAPFTLVSSTIEQADINGVNVVNLHSDTYGYAKDAPLQGPFTEKFVGGKPYRHTWNNFDTNSNNMEDRAEGWRLSSSADQIRLLEATYDTEGIFNADLARSVFYRDETAKRPVNIRNIQQLTGTALSGDFTVLGNYTQPSQVVMTNARSINNRFLAESSGDLLTASSDSYYLSGVIDFTLPRYDLTGSNKNIIVNRFAAPGDPATMCRGMLEITAGEYSVYNALPWRNLMVRIPLDEWYRDHCKQFGYFSDAFNSSSYVRAGETYPGTSGSVSALNYDGSASFHKVNRNTKKQPRYTGEYNGDAGTIETGSLHDNWFIQHQIPQSDMQYAWITSSVTQNWSTPSTGYVLPDGAIFGFEQPDFANASLASTDITFMSSSDVILYDDSGDITWATDRSDSDLGSSIEAFYWFDFVGLNIGIHDPVSSSDNFLGYEAQYNPTTTNRYYLNDYYTIGNQSKIDKFFLNTLLLHRNGPYQHPSWKQVRGDQHPIVRTHRQENRISYVTSSTVSPVGRSLTLINTRGFTSSIEPMITSKFKPMVHNLIVKKTTEADPTKVELQPTVLAHTYMNNISYFTDHSAEGYSLDQKILDPARNTDNREHTLDAINYYLNTKDFIDAASSEYNPIQELVSYTVKETVFPKEQYTYLSKIRGRGDYLCPFWRETHEERIELGVDNGFGYTIPSQSMWALDGRLNITTATPKTGGYNGAGRLLSNAAIYFDKDGKYLVSALYTMPTSSSAIGGYINDVAWDAGVQSGLDPFASSYAAYALEMQNLGKDYGIIPEFRVSEYIEDYISTGYSINARNPDLKHAGPSKPFLSLTGSTLDNTSSDFYKIYSNSDFLKYFAVRDITEDKSGTVLSNVKLKCKAMMKFLPYDGFYPAQRTAQMAELFSASYLMGGISSGSARAGLTPFYGPGIMYNSIKSGLACDFPMPIGTISRTAAGSKYFFNPTQGTKPIRIPFEAIIDPASQLTAGQTNWKDLQIDPDSYINTQYTFEEVSTVAPEEYKLAANNFFAESINFFLPGGRMQNFVSLPGNHPSFGASADKLLRGNDPPATYKMSIVLSNYKSGNGGTGFSNKPSEFVMYNDATAFGVPFGAINGYAAYIPACYGGTDYSASAGLTQYQNYEAYGFIELEWTPEDRYLADEYDFEYIVNHLTASTNSIGNGLGGGPHSMMATASININVGRVLSTEYDALTGQATSVSEIPNAGSELDVLIIEPKWECPMLNFSSSAQTNVAGTGDIGRVGMWHQTGSIDESAGIYMTIADPDGVTNGTYGSLANLLGFDKTNGKGVHKRLGSIAPTKEISEAVVAIPFTRSEDGTTKQLFKISRSAITQAELVLDGKNSQLPENILPDQSIIEMVRKMRTYVIPPHMDFVTYSNNTPGKSGMEQIPGGPFAMYIFEFKHTLTQQDLANIWQNLPPTSMGAAPYYHESDAVEISHEVFNSNKLNLLNGLNQDDNKSDFAFDPNKVEGRTNRSKEIVEELHWMVFKVKKRAATNYYDKTTNINDGGQFQFKFANQDTGFPTITYNWPYDYFSMVELVKLDAEMTMKPNDGTVIQKTMGSDTPEQAAATSGQAGQSGEGLGSPGGPPELGNDF